VPLLYAHRGANRRAPENTLTAFRLAIEEGADGVELDVRMAASGEVVVAHDPHLERVSGQRAWVAELPYARLREVRIGEDERVPLLDEAIDLVVGAGLRLNVEVKGDVPDRLSLARAVGECLARRSASERAHMVLSTFDPVVLLALRWHVRGVPIAFLFDGEHTGPWRGALLRRVLCPDGLHPHHALCTPATMRRWKARGLFVSPWTVNDPQRARWLASLGVSALITDDVPGIRDALS
jgi:glycerophosphoryl diester phosphodiesterase